MSSRKKSAKKAVGKGKTPAKSQAETKRRGARGRLSALDAAAAVLKEARQPMSCGQIMKVMLEKGLWKTSGKTPASTLYSAMLRDIKNKGNQSRFVKAERGRFTLAH